MNKYVVDTWVWVEYFEGNNQKIKAFIDSEENKIYISTVTISEVISFAKRKGKDVDEIFKALVSLSQVFAGDYLFYKEVGLLHAEVKKKIKDFGLADAFILATARRLNAKILTGDPHFKGFREVIFIK